MPLLPEAFTAGKWTFRRVKPTDLELFYRLYSNPMSVRYQRLEAVRTRADAAVLLELVFRAHARGTSFRWVVEGVIPGEGALRREVGMVSLYDLQSNCGSAQCTSAQCGYILDPLYWNRGMMTDILRGMSAHVLSKTTLKMLCASIHPENRASIRVAEKSGYTRLPTDSEDVWVFKAPH